MKSFCQGVVVVFALFYLIALGLWAAGTFGVFGVARDPLSGIFLIPLGLPWNQFIDVFPEPLWPWMAALAPLVNLLLIRLVCRQMTRRRGVSDT